ncbi:beta-microseminoprotein-like [Fukomys damarensis]|uniref:beta-microseminoprotein-like n=1 Tax=Fukomys damarensis TaxID=885580 RepID=UPI001454E684|nr:beta-microseminoprotein-like [Fukomys damarensis]
MRVPVHSISAMTVLTLQKHLLGSLLVLATFMTSCSARCYFTPRKETDFNSTNAEFQAGKISAEVMVWASMNTNNVAFVKIEHRYRQSHAAAVPADYDKIKCHAIFYPQNCTYTVVEHQNPSKTCAVSAWIL